MRKLPLGVAISTGVHAVALGWVGASLPPKRAVPEDRPRTEIQIVDVVKPMQVPDKAPDEAPVEVALLDEPRAAPAASGVAVAPRPRPAPARPEISTGRPTGPETAPASATSPGAGSGSSAGSGAEPARPGLLSMRRGDKPDLHLPAGQWDAIDHVPRGTTPEQAIHSGLLHDAAGGLHKADQGTFTGQVNADGTVALSDARNLSVSVALPSAHDLGNGLSAWYNGDKTGGAGEGGSAPLAKHFQASSGATTNLGDRTQPNANDQKPTIIVPVIGGHFDTTDWLMRRHGMDPYASKKLKFLDSTRDERAQIGGRYRDQQLGQSGRLMAQSLEELRRSGATLAERKQALFELWDDCVETGEARAVQGASDARRLVVSFIRLHLPAGGPDAYTPAELAALARRKHSKAEFAPYEP